MTINMLTPIVNKVREMLNKETASKEMLNQSMIAVSKDSLRGMSEFVLIGSLIPASIMAGAIKAFEELELDIHAHSEQLLFAAIQGATAVKVSLKDAVYGSSFQLFLHTPDHFRQELIEKLSQFITDQPVWNKTQKKVAQASLQRAVNDLLD